MGEWLTLRVTAPDFGDTAFAGHQEEAPEPGIVQTSFQFCQFTLTSDQCAWRRPTDWLVTTGSVRILL
jgi:hypothetical protein